MIMCSDWGCTLLLSLGIVQNKAYALEITLRKRRQTDKILELNELKLDWLPWQDMKNTFSVIFHPFMH